MKLAFYDDVHQLVRRHDRLHNRLAGDERLNFFIGHCQLFRFFLRRSEWDGQPAWTPSR